ncbi:MAG: carboxypeptidase regulatory-like domain-containing protein, partial [Acidobacteriota bacterium]|nr:carboxypeptidase regulatory-like domain-containing protein [Acidobacteriota bacterium]
MSSSRKAKALAFITSWVFALVTILPLTNVQVMAQATTGTLRGTVTDATGAIIPGATIRVKSQQTNVELPPVQSNDAGIYTIPNLNPGQYTITVEQTGFSRAQITDVTISIGQITTHDIALKPGQVTETVTITAGTDVEVQRDQAQVSQTFQPRQVAELPSNAAGGGLDTLLLNVPGVAQNSGGGTNTNGTGLSVNGNRGRSNNFQIDGSDNNDLSVGGPSLFIDNQDQVQEYQIITNNFSAQYGRNLGAVVNVVTKGGTNDFHGTGFEYHRDQRNLDSLNNVERAGGSKYPPRFLSNVFGGTIGGPLMLPRFGEGGKSYISGKNKAFFFFSYEGIRQPQETLIESGSIGILGPDLARLDANNPGNPIIHAIATASAFALPLGTVAPRATKGPATQTACLNPGAKTTANPLGIVACGAPGAQGPFQLGGAFDVVRINNIYYQAAFIQRTVRTDFTQDEWSIRGDQKVTDKDSYYLRYLNQTSFALNAGAGSNGWTWDLPAAAKNFGGSYI